MVIFREMLEILLIGCFSIHGEVRNFLDFPRMYAQYILSDVTTCAVVAVWVYVIKSGVNRMNIVLKVKAFHIFKILHIGRVWILENLQNESHLFIFFLY